MKKMRLFFLSILLPLVLFIVGSLGGLAGCGASSLVGLDGPVDIPVTISRLTDGVDASSVQFVPSSSSSALNLAGVFYGNQEETEEPVEVGTIFFRLINNKCINTSVIVDGEFWTTVTSSIDQNCQYQFTITDEFVNTPISLVVHGPGSTPYNGGPFSEPVIVQVNPPDDYTTAYTATVFNSNVAANSSDISQSGDVQDAEMAFTTVGSDRAIVFSALSSGTTPALWSVPVVGGSPTELVSIDTGITAIEQSRRDGIDALYLIDGAYGTYGIDSLGEATALSFTGVSTSLLANGMSVSPSGDYVTFIADMDLGEGVTGSGIALYDVSEDSVLTTFHLGSNAGDSYTTTEEVYWASGSVVLASVYSPTTDTHALVSGDVGKFLSDPTDEVTGKLVIADMTGLSNIVTDANYNVYYNCAGSICRYSYFEETNETIVTLSGALISDNFKISGDQQSFLVFETVTEQPHIGIYSIETGETSIPILGSNPATPLVEDNIVAYHATLAGTRQVAVANLENNITANPVALAFVNGITYFSRLGVDYTFSAYGGRPPYTFSMVTGNGSIDLESGHYQATGEASELETLKVTDSNGDTATTSFEIPSAEASVSFGHNGYTSVALSAVSEDYYYDLVQQSDGKIVVVGKTDVNGEDDIYLARYDSDGELDTTFNAAGNTPGTVVLDVNDADYLNAVALMPDGSIVAAGGSVVSGNTRSLFVMYDTNGALVSSFGSSGVAVFLNQGANSEIKDIAVATRTNEVLAVGYRGDGASRDMIATKLSSDGTMVPTFGDNGLLIMDVDGAADIANALEIDEVTRQAYFTGTATVDGVEQCVLANISDEQLDTSLGTNGFLLTDSTTDTTCTTIEITNTAIYVAGSVVSAIDGKSNWYIKAYDTDGTTYSGSFGDVGDDSLVVNVSNDDSEVKSLIYTGESLNMGIVGTSAADGNGSVVTVGLIDAVSGSMETDTGFGDDGFSSFILTGTEENRPAKAIMNDAHGTFLVTGSWEDDGTHDGFLFELWP